MQPSKFAGRRSLGRSRALVLDLLRLSHNVPTFPVEREMDLSELASARQAADPRISWVALFVKAFALAAQEVPALRRSYISWPWPHLYEHRQSVAMVAVNREHQDEDWLFWLRLLAPEKLQLRQLHRQLHRAQTEEVSERFTQQLQFSLLPSLLRRLIWWGRLNLWPRRRDRWVGTFGISVLAAQGCYNRRPPHFLTSCLTYGPLDERGRMSVTLICDHRVLDGMAAAEAIHLLEEKLKGPVLEELREMAGVRAAA